MPLHAMIPSSILPSLIFLSEMFLSSIIAVSGQPNWVERFVSALQAFGELCRQLDRGLTPPGIDYGGLPGLLLAENLEPFVV